MSIQFKQSLILGVCLMSSSWSFAAVKEYQLVIDESPVNLTGKSLSGLVSTDSFQLPCLNLRRAMMRSFVLKTTSKNKIHRSTGMVCFCLG